MPVATLAAWLETAYWAQGRTLDETARSVAGSTLVLSATTPAGELVAFARVVTDGVFAAWIYDVVVHPGERGRGLGRRLMERLLEHPRVRGVRRWFLMTLDAGTFYEKLGFRRVTEIPAPWGTSVMMERPGVTTVTRGPGAG